MLVQFSIRNYKTFKARTTLSLIASNYDKETRASENMFTAPISDLKLLKSAVVYGANASGKSNLLSAFAFMRSFVLSSSRESLKDDEIAVDPFRLNTDSIMWASEFEVIFIHKDVLYRYGFEADRKRVVSEWLYYQPKTKEIQLFSRAEQEFAIHERSFSKGRSVVKAGLVRENSLLLSVATQFNEAIAIDIVEWFRRLKILSGLNEFSYQGYSMSKTENPLFKTRILNLLKAADFHIQDLIPQKIDVESIPANMPKELREDIIRKIIDEHMDVFSDILTTHKQYDKDKQYAGNVSFSLDQDESSGTRKFFALTGPILDVLEHGYTLIVDELDSRLHPNLVAKIVSLFNSREINTRNAQLVFNTHDTNLLGSGLFRRDQIWFTEKNKYGEARLYSLADFRSQEVRKTEPFEDKYIEGKYGAIPYLGMFDHLNQILFVNEEEASQYVSSKEQPEA